MLPFSEDFSAHILVLEDDPGMREILSTLLGEEGYTVEVAQNGEEALRRVSEAVDLLIFDIRMEGIDGLEALARMQARGLALPSLAITGFAGDDDPIRALRMGVGEYLRKPFRPDQLLEAVARLLDGHRHQVRLHQSVDDLRELSFWTLKALLGKPFPREEALRQGQLAAALGEAAGLLPATATCLLLVCLVLGAEPQAFQQPDCPGRIQTWVTQARERYDGSGPQGLKAHDIPLPARVLSLATAATSADPDALQRTQKGRFDPFLLEALGPLVLQRKASPESSKALSVARTLLAAGDRQAARHLLAELLAHDPPAPDAVEAALSLALLDPIPEPLIQTALTKAREVGPVLLARAMYRGGLIRLRRGQPELLREAAERLQGLDMPCQAALARLLTGTPNPDDAELVLRPEHDAELAPVVDLLLPHLGEQQGRRLAQRYPRAGPAAESRLRIQSFGGLEVHWGGHPVELAWWRGPAARHLFAFLAAQTRPVTEDALLENFWPEGGESSRRCLSSALSTIRRTLGRAGSFPVDPIQRVQGRFQLHPSLPQWHDLQEFQKAREARDWQRMAALHTGPYLEGCYMDWALRQRDSLEEALLEGLVSLAEAYAESDPPRAREWAQRALQIDELNQQSHAHLMRAYLKLGQPEQAVRHFQRCQEVFARELKLEPSLELFELFQRARLALP